ncbi:glycosyltransferase family 2 protein [Zoogloea sp.]|uniref:glycosyltransferase family 2 protein n=1 Tax=Zoogloea sp. TaxID=49181 RepID=UPI0035B0DD07
MSSSSSSSRPVARLLSVVLPAYREEAGIARVLTELEQVLATLDMSFEVIVVDDGSPDRTFQQVSELCAARPWLRGLRLSRNFGKESALLAGLQAARGDAVITLDADLQHPPALIPELVAAWRQGAMVVNGVKADRSVENQGYASLATLITEGLGRLTGISLRDASDYKLLDRQVVDILTYSLAERQRFFRGLSQWVGFRQVDVPFKVAPSTRRTRNWSFGSLLRLTGTALVSFTSAPLQVITVLGVLTLLMAVLVGGEALVSRMAGRAVSGFTTLILTLLIIGSFIMISLGILGAYVAKIYEEIKGRPSYLVAERCGATGPGGGHRYRRVRR